MTVVVVAAQTPFTSDLVLHFDVDLVQVDVIVTDSQGRRVTGLKADDFEIRQDGKPQSITHFLYAPGVTAPTRPAPVAHALKRDEVRRTFVVILDDANIQFRDFSEAQKALLRLFDEDLDEGDMAAVVRTSMGSGASQILTFDHQWLHRTVERMVWRPPLPFGRPPLMAVLTQVLRALRNYPGRKSILLISPGYLTMDYLPQERAIADTANRSSVTIETIDVRGFPVLAPAATNSGMPRPSIRGFDAASFLSSDESAFRATQNRTLEYIDSQRVLAFLAGMTAGRFHHDNNDMYRQVKAAVDDSEGYYLIGWYPGPDAFAPQRRTVMDYHRLKVRVRGRSGLTVRTRDGFFAWAGATYQPVYSPARQMREALFSSFATGDIDVRLAAVPGYDEQAGQYVDSLLHILPKGVEFRDTPEHPGCKVVSLEILGTPMPLDPFKEPMGRLEGQSASYTLCGSGLAAAQSEGFVATIRDQIPVPGPYQMRVAVRNVGPNYVPAAEPEQLLQRDGGPTERIAIGSASEIIEVPDLKAQDFALTGITLWGDDVPAPQPGVGVTFRPLKTGDPAVRGFHAGETVRFAYRVVRNPKKPADPLEVRFGIVHNGKDLFVSEPLPEAGIASYRLDPSWAPGSYLLGVRAQKPGSKSPAQMQWIDFEITSIAALTNEQDDQNRDDAAAPRSVHPR